MSGKLAKVFPDLWYLFISVEACPNVSSDVTFVYLQDFVNTVNYTGIYICWPDNWQALGIFYIFYIL